METGSKIEKLVIGGRDLKDHLGRYLVQGLVVSVFLHSAVVAFVGLWPSGDSRAGKEIVIFLDPLQPRTPDTNLPDVPDRPKPKPPEKPEIDIVTPVDDEPVLDTTQNVENETLADLRGPFDSDGTVDTGSVNRGGLGGIDTATDVAGFKKPWEEFVVFEEPPVALNEINQQPAYPKSARIAGINGMVRVWVHISDRGDVLGWHVIDVNPPGLGFEDEVANVIPKWRFTPAIQQNNPVAVWVAIPFKFRVSP